MKKIFVWCMFLGVLLSGCRKTEENRIIESFDAEQELFTYAGTENVDALAVDENGILYTIVLQNKKQLISAYALDGTLLLQKELLPRTGMAEVFQEKNGKLYLVLKEYSTETREVLYEIDTDTWEVKELFEFKDYNEISGICWIGDSVYAIGKAKNREVKNYALHPDVVSYSYNCEAVCKVDFTAEIPKASIFRIDFPIAIAATEQGTLAIYCYTEENGFGFLEYNPKENTLVESGWNLTQVPSKLFADCMDGFIFVRGNTLYYGKVNGSETEIYDKEVNIVSCAPAYKKGFVFWREGISNSVVMRIGIVDKLKENKVLRVLAHKDLQYSDWPYSCGYQMQKEILASEEFALKVLSQDKNFDVFVLSSRDNATYNLKQNGAFYPLNEVEGVQEYLDACFPYVKELAINEEGDIWMLPVILAIPGLTYNAEYCESKDVDITTMDFEEFLTLAENLHETEPGKIQVSYFLMMETLFGQYFQIEDSFDTPLFRTYLKKIKDIYETVGGSGFIKSATISTQMVKAAEGLDDWPEFYYLTEVYEIGYMTTANQVGDSEVIGVTAFPTIAEGVKNQGTITLIAVNPQSDNLEATLEYISSFSKYMLTVKDSFMLADETTYTNTPYIRDCYDVFANGAIRFDMDSNVYEDLFWEYVTGSVDMEETISEMERRRKLYMGE